jgi:hypothetical protein
VALEGTRTTADVGSRVLKSCELEVVARECPRICVGMIEQEHHAYQEHASQD